MYVDTMCESDDEEGSQASDAENEGSDEIDSNEDASVHQVEWVPHNTEDKFLFPPPNRI